MGLAKQPTPVKLIMCMLGRDAAILEAALEPLTARFGAIDYHSQLMPFEHTRYYEAELGAHPLRQYLAFAGLNDPGALAETKGWTNALELCFADASHSRPLNLDPGYITAAKLVLATTKNHAHRIYLSQGIYAEVTLAFRAKSFQPQPWTYPDYASPTCLAVMTQIREIYMVQRKTWLEGQATLPSA